MTLYCSNSSCLHKNDYIGAKPKCCSECGTPFDAAFKRPTPTFVTPASVQPAAQQPRTFMTQWHAGPPQTPDEIIASVGLDASSVRVESDRPQKLTVAGLQKMGGEVSFERNAAPSTQGTNPEIGAKRFNQFQDETFKAMIADSANASVNQPAPSRPARRKRSKS